MAQGTASPEGRQSEEPQVDSLLTPDGIRSAIKALKKESGRNRFGSFTVHPDFVTTQMMVNGSDTKYDSYTYRLGRGVEKGTTGRTLFSGDQPVDLDEYRYLMVRQPNDLRDTQAGMAVYLTDKYGAGFLEADTQGKVTDVNPAQD